MRATIITIGDEITSGQTVDTNAAYLAARLADLGVVVSRVVSVGDDVDAVAAEVKRATGSSDLLLVTGGLGPTHDDRTKEGVAKALGKRLVVDETLLVEIAQNLKRRGVAPSPVAEILATVPEGSTAISNPAGTAAGLTLTHDQARVFLLPGVPSEMKAIFESEVARDIRALYGANFIKMRLLRTVRISESRIAERIGGIIPTLGVSLAFLPGDIGVDLRLTCSAAEEDVAVKALDHAVQEILPALGTHLYSQHGEGLHFVVGKLLIQTGTSIALAESCTGGLISHQLTEVPGISACLERSIVAYSNPAKIDVLGVDEAVIERHGAVSEETAKAMACGVRERSGTDLGLSTTGIAGPAGGSDAKPVGLVYMALADGDGCIVADKVFSGSRSMVKKRAAAYGLDMLRCYLLGTEG